MNANATLLQMKYARVVSLFAKLSDISLSEALDFFYCSEEYKLISRGVSDLHCMSDSYLAENIYDEYRKSGMR